VDVQYVREVLGGMRVDVEEELALDLPEERARVVAQRIIEALSKEFRRGMTPGELGFFYELKEVMDVISGDPIGRGSWYYRLIQEFAGAILRIASRGPLGSEEEALLEAVEEAHALIIKRGSQAT